MNVQKKYGQMCTWINYVLVLCLFSTVSINAQFDLKEKLKNKALEKKEKKEQSAEEKVDSTLDAGLDSVEEGVESLFKKKETSQTKSIQKQEANKQSEQDTAANKNSGQSTQNLQSYSKFDFIPGDKVIYFEDFSQDAVGDFPDKWNTNASGEIVTIGTFPGRWLKTASDARYKPMIKTSEFPDNFTIEYDIFFKTNEGRNNLDIDIYSAANEQDFYAGTGTGSEFAMNAGGGGFQAFNWKDGVLGMNNDQSKDLFSDNAKVYHVSIWIQKQRGRLYVNETKVYDLPMFIPAGTKLNAISFYSLCFENQNFISNIRIAVGAPDMRSKLMTEGKLVTRGILFDVNSDKIKAESYGTLKEIAQVLKDNAGVKVKIVGHTDSDGDDKSNLELSKRRAASVKVSLSTNFGIDAARMETDGKGESQPAGPNTTPEGKANNRRVEFIKL